MKHSFSLLLALTGTLLAADPAPTITEGSLLFKNPNIVFQTADKEIVVGSASKLDPLLQQNGFVLTDFESAIVGSEDGDVSDQSSVTLTGAENFKLRLMAGEPVAVTRSVSIADDIPKIVWKAKK